MKHIGTQTIKTQRLILRKLEIADAEMMFNNTDIERIQSYSSVKNPASRKVMEKVGMRYEGLSRHSYRTRDGFQDCTFFGIIRDEWEQMKSILTI